jgi:hypothetical protein
MRYLILICVLTVSLAGAETILTRVDAALESGEISVDQAARYLVYSVYDESLIPGWILQGTVSDPCGTAAMDRATALLDECSEEVAEELLTLLSRPEVGDPEYLYDSPEGWFLIHWTDFGPNATNESYVAEIADAMDWSWQHQCIDLGFEDPPSDLGLGGDDRYDIYMLDCDGGTLGWCSTAGDPSDPMGYPNSNASHIAIDIDVGQWGIDQMRETCTHEFQHAVQNAYAHVEPSWFKENCSVWMQNECYETNHYADYLKSGENCLSRPWYDIRSGAMYHYGGSPWPMYMEVGYDGTETVREVWYQAAIVQGVNILDAIDVVAKSYGKSFTEWLADYGAWRWFTDDRACHDYWEYEESSLWYSGPYVFNYHRFSSYPDSGDHGVYPQDTYGVHWILCDVSDHTNSWLQFSFDGRDYRDWIVGYIQTDDTYENSNYSWVEVTEQSAEYDVAVATESWTEIVFYIYNNMDSSLQVEYEFTVDIAEGMEEEPGTGHSVQLTPESNPITSGQSLTVSLSEAGYASLNVYDLSGRMVQRIASGQFPQGETILRWEAGDLSPGAYLLRLSAPGGGLTRKVVLQ